MAAFYCHQAVEKCLKALYEKDWVDDYIKKTGKISQLWDCDLTLEAVCYTPEELERKKAEIGIIGEAVKYGIDI